MLPWSAPWKDLVDARMLRGLTWSVHEYQRGEVERKERMYVDLVHEVGHDER